MTKMVYGATNNNTLIFSNKSTNKTFGHEMDFTTKSPFKQELL